MDGSNDLRDKLRNPLMTKGSHRPDSLCQLHTSPCGQIPYELGKESGDRKGISSPGSDKLWLVSRYNECCVYAVHSGSYTCTQTWQEMPTKYLSLSPEPAVCVCVYRPNCVQVLPWWIQMTQKKAACLLVVLEERGNGVERQRATSPSLLVCSLTFIVLFVPSHRSSKEWIGRTKTVMI